MHYWSNLLRHTFALMAGLDAEAVPGNKKSDPEFLSTDGWMDPIYDPSCLQFHRKEDRTWNWSRTEGLLNHKDGSRWLVPLPPEKPLRLREDARFERDFQPEEIVTVLSRHDADGITRQLVISRELYTTTLLFQDFEENVIPAVEEFLDMPTGQQAVVLAFLNNPFYMEDYFPALCCLASYARENGGSLPGGKELERVVREFNTFCVPRRNTDTVNALECRQLLDASRIPQLGTKGTWYTFLALWALMNGCSVWSQDPGGPALALVRSDMKYSLDLANCLNRICTKAMTEALAADLLHIAARQPLSRRHAEFLLKVLLCWSKTLPAQRVPAITRQLLRSSEDLSKFQYLSTVLHGPNGECFLAYVRQEFCPALARGDTDYAYALAAIRSHLRTGQPEQPVSLTEDAWEDAVLTLAELTLEARKHIRNTGLTPMHLTLTEHDPVLQQLLVWLRDRESPCHILACDAAEYLYLVSALDNRLLEQEAIVLTAAQCTDGSPNPRALKVLGSLPLTARIPDFSGKHILTEVLPRQFFHSLDTARLENIVPLFRSCVVAGCWSRQQMLENYRTLTAALAGLPELLQGLEAARFHILKQEVHLLIRTDTSVQTDPDILENFLFADTPPDTAPAEQILANLKKQPALLQLITGQKEALSILHYIRTGAGDADAELLLDRCIPEISDAGSLVITQWYYLLCIFGRIKAALHFRNRHQPLLERPCHCHVSARDGKTFALLPRYADFLQATSRGQLGLEMAVLLASVDPGKPWRYNQQLHTLSNAVLRARKGLSGDTCEQNLHAARAEAMSIVIPATPESLWDLYYDDPGLTRLVLKHCPGAHRRVLCFSYGADPEMALTAVQTKGESLLYVSGWLKKDDAICTAALKKCSKVINLIQAPMLRDHDLIRKLLKDRPIPLSMAPEWLCQDRAFVLEHLKHRPQDFSFVSPDLQADKEVVLTALEASGNKDGILCRIPPALRRDADILRLCGGDQT